MKYQSSLKAPAVRLLLAAAILALAAAPAPALPPEWDRKTVSPACPFCGSTIGWNSSTCYSCQAQIDWELPEAPKSGEEGWLFLETAIARRDRDFLKMLIEGDPAENERSLAMAPLTTVAASTAVEGGERVVVISTDKATALVLMWSKGRFQAQREAYRPMRNQVEAVKALHAAVEAEKKLREADLDGNGGKDWWTGDWSGLARLVDAEGKPLALIAPELGAADLRPLPSSAEGATRPRLAAAAAAAPWNGYRFAALDTDERGRPLAANTWENAERFAFIASPAERGVTGWMTLVVSEDGAVWGKDLGEATGHDAVAVPPTAGETAAIAAAIRDLDADALDVREAADARLRALGQKAKSAMKAALPGASPEPRRRLRDLLHDLEETAPDLRRWPAETKDLLDAGWERL